MATELELTVAQIRKTRENKDVQKRFETEFAPKIDIEKALNAPWLADYEQEQPIL